MFCERLYQVERREKKMKMRCTHRLSYKLLLLY